ncbi:hypothetical protein JMM63_18070 [Rhodovulum sulfidophilum]|uniref:hypothetical protein n=1 Tax=Rhodovulum sulfidophilum TaxID=35806 RepID=UPI001920D975|nr:hypothetical protein [Rhodovulum sulfidophilum]MBL3597441.1 hypothetical protein [Rhodovulum sulfidophilum]
MMPRNFLSGKAIQVIKFGDVLCFLAERWLAASSHGLSWSPQECVAFGEFHLRPVHWVLAASASAAAAMNGRFRDISSGALWRLSPATRPGRSAPNSSRFVRTKTLAVFHYEVQAMDYQYLRFVAVF